MTPGFALSLSFDGIRLLQRASDGWRLVGDVPLETEDLPGALSVLLDTARALSPEGVTCKLIIPNTQIKYLTLETGNTDEAARWVAARAALDGATPYAVSDLAFDLVHDGPKTHVAAVAHETLEEAEAFAAGYGFCPVSFVATADATEFPGEPFFGETAWARDELGPAAGIHRDAEPIFVVGPAEMPVAPVLEGSEDPDPIETPEEAADSVDAQSATDPDQNGLPDEQEAEGAPQDVAQDTHDFAPEETDTPPEAEALSDATSTQVVEEPPEPDQFDDPEPVHVSEPALEEEPPTEPQEDPQNAPLPVLTFRSATRVRRDPAPEPGSEDTGPAIGFASRRTNPDAAPALAGVTRNAPAGPRISIDAPNLPQDIAEGDANTGLVPRATPIDEPAPDAAASLVPSPNQPPQDALSTAQIHARALAAATPTPEEAERLTVFGARQSGAEVGGKPRFLGLMLTLALIVFLAGVAGWSSVFSDDGIAGFFSSADEPVLTQLPPEAVTLPDPLPKADIQPAEPAPERTAALDPALTDEDAAVLDALRDTRSDPTEPAPIDPIAFYEKTGIWSAAPDVPRPTALVPLDGLYEPGVDRGAHQRESRDAVALPTLAALGTDAALLPFSSPAPPKTTFRLDARGLVIPTPEGAVNPDGVRVYAGRPPAVPPPTPDRTARTNQEVETDPLKLALAAIRPQTRPQNLVEDNARAAETGPAQTELAIYRPVARPALLRTPEEEAAEEPDAPATAQAIAVSRRPDSRPRNFSRIVARATPRPEVATPVRLPPRTVSPSIPSSASVAREATIRNAINLRRINLIGVFGTPSDRRALVLMPNGRQRKVKVGDSLDGGRVSAIGDSELRYQKRGRNLILKMPQG